MARLAPLLVSVAALAGACDGSSAPAEQAPDATVDPEVDAGVDAPPLDLGEPIVIAPEDYGRWIWFAMPEMKCADGSEGGFAMNVLEGASELLFFLQGGGICYDSLSCSVGGAARNVGADPLATALDPGIRDHVGIFNRDDTANPFRGASYVVVPHCTGDFHLGTKATNHPGVGELQHVGYTNITHALARLVPTFQAATRITLAGFSAGGVGITGNYQQIAAAFALANQPPPALIADGSPLVRPPFLTDGAQVDLRTAWGLDASIETICPNCLDLGFHAIYGDNLAAVPGLRSSLICAYEDGVVVTLFGLLNRFPQTGARLREGLVDLATWADALADAPSTHRTFYYNGTRHGALNPPLADTPGLVEFLAAQLDANATWNDVRP